VDGEHFSYDQWQPWYEDKQRGVTINSDNFSGLNHKMAVDGVAAATTPRLLVPPTMSGWPRNSGRSRCSTDA
jgi:leucyl-tRNA synthetase